MIRILFGLPFFLSLFTLFPFSYGEDAAVTFSEKWNEFLNSFVLESHELQVEVVEGKAGEHDLSGLLLAVILGKEGDFHVAVNWKEYGITAARNGDEFWVYTPAKKFGVVGKNEIPLYRTNPDLKHPIDLDRLFHFPMTLEQLRGLPLLFQVKVKDVFKGESQEQGREGIAFVLSPTPLAHKLLGEHEVEVQWLFDHKHTGNSRLTVTSGKEHIALKLSLASQSALPSIFAIPEKEQSQFQETALYHLAKGYRVISDLLLQNESGEPRAWTEGSLLKHGKGVLKVKEGVALLYLEGSPEEMGEQQGVLVKEHAKFVYDRLLYGVGVGTSFVRGSWFFGDIEEAQARLTPYMNPDYLKEMDALADAMGVDREFVRLGNFFPELFHCSGFALFDEATQDGMLYHGRILDYMAGFGLEKSAVVTVVNPDRGNRWVNIGYAGFLGTVTAMNEQGVAIGEMGGKGWGDWDGKPMAQLMREVMEQAGKVEEGIQIFEQSPRTCEYYYVLSQAKPNYAVGLAATPEKLEVIQPGELHPRLSKPLKDTVMLSAGDRYVCLTDRVEEAYGKVDALKAWELMSRPVAMKSNIQTALFRPETLDFWVAYSTKKEVASARQPVQFNLKELLDEFTQHSEETP